MVFPDNVPTYPPNRADLLHRSCCEMLQIDGGWQNRSADPQSIANSFRRKQQVDSFRSCSSCCREPPQQSGQIEKVEVQDDALGPYAVEPDVSLRECTHDRQRFPGGHVVVRDAFNGRIDCQQGRIDWDGAPYPRWDVSAQRFGCLNQVPLGAAWEVHLEDKIDASGGSREFRNRPDGIVAIYPVQQCSGAKPERSWGCWIDSEVVEQGNKTPVIKSVSGRHDGG